MASPGVLCSLEYVSIEGCQSCITLNCCEGYSIAVCSQWLNRIIREDLQSDAANDGFLPLFHSLSHFSSLSSSLVFTPSIFAPPSVSNFLRIIRPSSEPGPWKTLLQIAPCMSRFSSQRTSSTSNLQVGRECEMKYTGSDLRCQLKVCVCLSCLDAITVIWSHRDSGNEDDTYKKKHLSGPIWQVILLSLWLELQYKRWALR